jgi:LPXTG-site transpeptidase (sortase) family protein
VPNPALTGPGSIVGTDMTIVSGAANLNANVSARSVGTNGQMGDPIGAWMVLWYDFSQNWPGVGGYPGEPGANAVFAGHVDYIRVGPAVFWGTRSLVAGDQVTVNTSNGPITYVIQWSTSVGPYDDFTGYVSKTGEEIITLVTCVGEFSGGHYSARLIVRGKRI